MSQLPKSRLLCLLKRLKRGNRRRSFSKATGFMTSQREIETRPRIGQQGQALRFTLSLKEIETSIANFRWQIVMKFMMSLKEIETNT